MATITLTINNIPQEMYDQYYSAATKKAASEFNVQMPTDGNIVVYHEAMEADTKLYAELLGSVLTAQLIQACIDKGAVIE